MEDIGKFIVEICGGVSFIIRVVGSFLYGKIKEKWRVFKDDLMLSRESGKDIMDYVL